MMNNHCSRKCCCINSYVCALHLGWHVEPDALEAHIPYEEFVYRE